jgi:DNA-binding CsgD family transcriptional regulator
MSKWKNRRPGVVASVEQQTAEAAALAHITGQGRLADPRTNPAVRAHADRLRDEQHRRALDAEHARLLRRHRVGDRRAEHAERTLEAIQSARSTMSAARSVMALHRGRFRFLAVALAASVSLSVGSAIGVAALARQLGAPSTVGYLAEIGLTGLTTTVILYRSHLAEHGGTVEGWQARVLWLLMLGPLAASIAANATSTGPVGVFCSIGAAAFSLLSYVISDRSAAALRDRAADVTGDEENELRAIATGEDLFALPTDAERDAEALGNLLDEGGRPELFSDAALAEWLQEPPDDGVTSPLPSPVTGGPHSAAIALPRTPETETVRPGQIEAEQDRHDAETGAGDRVESAAAARRAVGAINRARVAACLADHPDATVEQIADALALSVSTVKRHRRAIRSE